MRIPISLVVACTNCGSEQFTPLPSVDRDPYVICDTCCQAFAVRALKHARIAKEERVLATEIVSTQFAASA